MPLLLQCRSPQTHNCQPVHCLPQPHKCLPQPHKCRALRSPCHALRSQLARPRLLATVPLLLLLLLYLGVDRRGDHQVTTTVKPKLPETGIRKLPGCIIIGARKCGTRALLEMLSLHSGIRAAQQEVHFFDNETNYARGYAWYLNQMPQLLPGQVAVEKSPSYLVTVGVAERVRAMDPNVKLVLIVREPVTRLISDFTQIMYNRMEKGLPTKSFEETIIREDDSIDVDYYGVDTGLYHLHLSRWFQYFPPDQIRIVNGDRLIKTPWREVAGVEQFLGIDSQISDSNFYFNQTKGFHCLREAKGVERCLAKSKGRPHPKVDLRTISLLRKFYKRHNYKFYDLVGKDFGWPEE